VVNSTKRADGSGSTLRSTSRSGTPIHGITIDQASTQRMR
jgi:hypothetical protein